MSFLKEKEEKERAKKEAQALKNQLMCKICWENPLQVTFIPCGHMATCKDCAEKLQDECPICRQDIIMKQTTFI